MVLSSKINNQPQIKGFSESFNLQAALATQFHNRPATASNRVGSSPDNKPLVLALRTAMFRPSKKNLRDTNLILLELIGLLNDREGICGNKDGAMKQGFTISEEDPLVLAVQSFKNKV